jgi:hypothetical protein
VKWFRPGPGSDEMRASITALIERGRPPHPAFVWPIDRVSGCPACRAAVFFDPEQAGPCCWNCSAPLPVPVTLKLRGSLLVLSEDAVLTSHHLNRDRDYRTACAVVEPDPRQPGRSVLRNLTGRTWTVVPTARNPSGWPRTSGWAYGRCASISARPAARSSRPVAVRSARRPG